MNILNQFKIAFKSLGKNRMRSLLTMLGIIIGVGSVIAIDAIGEGSSKSIKSQIQDLGANMIIVVPEDAEDAGVKNIGESLKSLYESDIKYLQANISTIKYISPVVTTQAQVIYGNNNWQTSVIGTYPSYLFIRNYKIKRGVFFNRQDVENLSKVCIIGHEVQKRLFKDHDVLGKAIRIGNIPFKIIGILKEKGQGFGQNQDDLIIAPFTSVQRRMMGIRHVNQIYATALNEDILEKTAEQIQQGLRLNHGLTSKQNDDFAIRTQAEIIETMDTVTSSVTLLLSAIAGISLVVGGVGIMNIMLVSVSERTREIGLRISVGAKDKDILFQFLIESVVLSAIGGIIGILSGASLATLVGDLLNWEIVFSSSSILISFLFAALVGIFFGWYPSKKAASLNPIEALKNE